MSKTLYEEALADAKQLREIAEDNARRAVIEAVIPRIRKEIEKQLIGEHGMGVPEEDGEMMGDMVSPDVVPVADPSGAAGAITPPDAEGKVTLDLDTLSSCGPAKTALPPASNVPEPPPAPAMPGGVERELGGSAGPVDVRVVAEPEYELSMESLKALQPLVERGSFESVESFRKELAKVTAEVVRHANASRIIRESATYRNKIVELIARIEDMYSYVQEQAGDFGDKDLVEAKLEKLYGKLNRLKESKMKKGLVKEGDLTIKLTGVPDDMDVDELGIDLITGEEEEGEGMEGGDELAGAEDLGGEEGGEDLGDLGAEGGEEGQGDLESDEDMEEADMVELDENDVVEISESMLRKEIARMKKLHEYAADGHKVPVDDFGGGADEGEPWLDGEVSTNDKDNMVKQGGGTPKSIQREAQEDDMDENQDQMDEQDDQMDEMYDQMDEEQVDEQDDQMDEQDQMDELQLRRKEDEHGVAAANAHSVQAEGVGRRLRTLESQIKNERKAQLEIQKRLSLFKNEAVKAKGTKKESVMKQRAMKEAQRLKASSARLAETQKKFKEASKLQKEGAGNRSSARPADYKVVAESLRKQLNETNLFNAKLLYTNKLLQTEGLSPKQKATVIERLDEARTLREVKLVYESLVKALGGKRSLREGAERQVLGGSSSRPTTSGSSQVNESVQTARWARLAGILKS